MAAAPGQQVPLQPHYVVLNPAQQRASLRLPFKAKYFKSSINSVKGLTLAQLVMGIAIFILHIITTAMNDHVHNEVAAVNNEISLYWFLDGFTDHAATGIWVGLLTIVAASIGVAGYKQQKRSLIVAHLVLNIFLLVGFVVLVGTLSGNIETLVSCRRRGEYTYSRYSSYGATRKTVTVFGETLGPNSYFYCKHAMFKAWLALDCIILVCALGEFFVTLTLLVYNSIAACACCRRTGCCGSCCCFGCCPVGDEGDHVVSYQAQPVSGVPQLQAVPQPHMVPQLYAQPAAPVTFQYMQQPMTVPGAASGAAVYNQPPTAQAPAAQAAVNSSDGKWEDLPPEYASVLENQPR